MAEAEYLSPAELELLEQQELEGFRPEVDANASLPPIPAGNYQARVTYANENEPDKIWQKKQQTAAKGGKVFYMAELRVETTGNGPEFDGRTMRFYASTLVMGSGTTSVQQVLQPLGYGEQLKQLTRTVGTQINLMNQALEGGQALIGVKVDWEAGVYDKESDTQTFGPVRGMKRFPKDANGEHTPVIFKDLKGNEAPTSDGVQARNFIRGFMSLDALAGTAPTSGAVEEGEEPEQEQTEEPVVAEPAKAVQKAAAAPPVAPKAPTPPAASTAPAAQQVKPAARPTAPGRTAPARRS